MLNVPINYLTTLKDLEELIKVGVGEFYLGYMPKQWYQVYGWEVSTNRRYFPVIPHIIDREKAEELVSFIHARGKKIFLALNEHYYTQQQYSLLFKIIYLFESFGIDGYIVSDLALILTMKKRGIIREIHLSSCVGLYNSSTLSFYRGLGIKHFILPRKISVNEIVNFLKHTSEEVSFEVFLIGEWCKFSDAFCFSSHGFNRENFCATRFKKYLVNKKDLSEKDLSFFSPGTVPWCGLCLISQLEKYKKRIVFKLPLRSACCPNIENIVLVKRVARLLKKEKVSLKQCQGILGDACMKSACAYQKV